MHNVALSKGAASGPENHDARLSVLGAEQAQALADQILAMETERARARGAGSPLPSVLAGRGIPGAGLDVVLTSPLTRCVQTALRAFAPVLAHNSELVTLVPCLALEELRELVSGSPHNSRRPRAELEAEFRGQVDFSAVPDGPLDAAWSPGMPREAHASCAARAKASLARVFSGEEPFASAREVALVSHSGFLYCLANYGLPALAAAAGGRGGFKGQGRVGPSAAQPLVTYGGDAAFELWFRSWWKPGELRSVVVEAAAG